MSATYAFHIDWNGDGDFSDTGETVTTRLLTRSSVDLSYGRDVARTGSPIAAGSGSLELDNQSKDYSPENSSSPLYGNLLQARKVRGQATLSAVTYTMWTGYTDDFQPRPSKDEKSVQITALDALARLKGTTISTPLYQGIMTGEAIGYVLDAVGWPAAERDIDRGATQIRFWWEDNADALTAVERVLNSEGVPALIYVEPSTGYFTFRDRHHRLTRSASTTSQATFRDTGAEPLHSPPLTYDHGWRNVVNAVSLTVEERQPSPDISSVWSSSLTYSLADGETLPLKVRAADPFVSAVTPEVDTDYTLASGAVTVTLSRDSGSSATIYITATGGPAIVTGMALRAYGIPVVRSVEVTAEDTVSIGRYGRRSLPESFDAPWAGVNDAQPLADILLAYRAERLPIVGITIKGSGDDTRMLQQLTRKLSDRVTIIDTETALNAEFHIERIEHRISEAGLWHETVLWCEKAPTTPGTAFTFDVAGKGFNDGTFTLGGLSNPSTLFTFDVAGKGFNDGLLAY